MLIIYDADKGDKSADKVAAALHLIQVMDPVRYRRVVRDLKQIWITTIPGAAGQFVRSTSTCELDERFVTGEHISIEEVAGAIVHEATHARLDQCGIGYEERLRTRVEEVCMRRELAFAAKLPEGAGIRRWVEARQNGPVDYSNAAFNTREIAGIRDAMIHLGMPIWFADTIVFIGRLRRRGSAKRQEGKSASEPPN
ncbi:hypothetical protein EJ076_32700 [Mesorhizobium sp. M7D.F.Ca.US.005.01.1.1]|uniref:hypothetical protein n=1 Tax=Mesorhizobium sp. M7D.F.Ca.US.005.01.1.1 TaxID=2493678 RepID=UPI000F74FDEA|nr:hypothetical protein [Mesorhizobium sp. M7D.F.Ca.US.005.01.1.1]AZO45514.1 hypothetical protein EJ076_32700 [Mesorhizobium sp. M7D.F.Ca.US.005.01.1.1]